MSIKFIVRNRNALNHSKNISPNTSKSRKIKMAAVQSRTNISTKHTPPPTYHVKLK
ncbi:hypothetical protein Bhyg_01195 [Pseudolycoriella hygida]|uniref:Uncharacterized protein n=1 Tax=Pseudolycoriella hygida TaxID=35572 RepID=A0A9Q0N8V4_9DIPT|nr:hypothetical protein Bhyg_01195 [Pseudolycoriella hygida]